MKTAPRRRIFSIIAEREGFEPSERFPVQHISSVLHSTALAPLRERLKYHIDLLLSLYMMAALRLCESSTTECRPRRRLRIFPLISERPIARLFAPSWR